MVREQLALLDPGRLADELTEIHVEVRAVLAAYDPAAFVDELRRVLAGVAQALRSLDPAQWLTPADVARLQATVDRVRDAVPAEAFRTVGAELASAADAVAAIDLAGLVGDVGAVSDRVQAELGRAITSIEQEIDALVSSLRVLAHPSGGA